MAAYMKEAVEEAAPEFSARLELVDRVVHSAAFAKSKRLISLLEFVCRLSLEGRAQEINEQRIGEDVFDRPPGYDPAVDGIVRTQASRLRQRLEQFFAEEGSAEPVKIVIPRGSYVPFFEERARSLDIPEPPRVIDVAAGSEAFPPASPEARPGHPPPMRRGWLLSAAAGWIAALIFALLALHYRRSSEATQHPRPKSHPLWRHFFDEGRDVLLVPEDGGLVLFQGITGRNLTLSEYTAGSYRDDPAPSPDPTGKIAALTGRRRYTSVVALEAVQQFGEIAASEGGHITLRYARDVRPNDLRDNEVILIGAPESNPWLFLFQPGMNFIFENDRAKHIFGIQNRRPQSGEPAEWVADRGPQSTVYAIVDYLPGLNERRDAMIVAGTAMAGTECALNFIYDDKQFSPFLDRIRRPDGTIPHFEVVLGTHAMEASALKPSVLAWRVHD